MPGAAPGIAARVRRGGEAAADLAGPGGLELLGRIEASADHGGVGGVDDAAAGLPDAEGDDALRPCRSP